MFRSPALRRSCAVLLLLVFGRLLVPDTAILALHGHAHTEKETRHKGLADKALFSAKHKHCPIEHLYEVPFQPAPAVCIGPRYARYAAPRSATRQSVWEAAYLPAVYSRGPPRI